MSTTTPDTLGSDLRMSLLVEACKQLCRRLEVAELLGGEYVNPEDRKAYDNGLNAIRLAEAAAREGAR